MFRGSHVGFEQVAILETLCVTHSLRVPLHSYQPALREIVGLDGLYYPIGSMGNHNQGFGQVLYRLVMVGVDPKSGSLHDLCCLRAFFYLDLVCPLPLRCLLKVCDRTIAKLRREVLVERSAKRRVQDLHTPADPEYRYTLLECVPETRHLEGVPLGDDPAELRERLLTIVAWVEVATSAQQKTIYLSHHLFGRLGDRWQTHGCPAGLGYTGYIVQIRPHERAQRALSDKL